MSKDRCETCRWWDKYRTWGDCDSIQHNKLTRVPLYSVVEGRKAPFNVHKDFGCIFHEVKDE